MKKTQYRDTVFLRLLFIFGCLYLLHRMPDFQSRRSLRRQPTSPEGRRSQLAFRRLRLGGDETREAETEQIPPPRRSRQNFLMLMLLALPKDVHNTSTTSRPKDAAGRTASRLHDRRVPERAARRRGSGNRRIAAAPISIGGSEQAASPHPYRPIRHVA